MVKDEFPEAHGEAAAGVWAGEDFAAGRHHRGSPAYQKTGDRKVPGQELRGRRAHRSWWQFSLARGEIGDGPSDWHGL
jgi:hypothetical protein